MLRTICLTIFVNFSKKNEEMQSISMSLISSSNKTLALPRILTEHSGRKSLRFQCASLWNYYASNKIQLDNDRYYDLNKIKSGSHLKALLKKHFKFYYMN